MHLTIKNLGFFFALAAFTSVFQELNAQQKLVDSLEFKVLQHKDRDTIMVNLLNEAAYNLRRIDLSKSLKHATEGLELSEELDFKKGKARSLNAIGNYNYLSSDYPKALEYFERSIEVSAEIEYEVELSFSYNGIGMAYGRQGNYSVGLEFIQKALKINEKLGNETRVAFALYTIGTSYSLQGNFSVALEYFQRSLKLSEKLGEWTFFSVALRDIGQAQTNLGNYPEALSSFQRTTEIMEELKGISSTMISMGTLHKKLNDQARAADYFQRAIEISEENGFKHNLCNALISMSAIYLEDEVYSKALTFSLRALEIAKELEILPEQKDIYGLLSKIYERKGQYQNAYKSERLYQVLNDSIFNEESIRTITQLEYFYQYEKEKEVNDLIEQKKNAVQMAETKWQKTIRNFFIVGFATMGGLVIFVFRTSRQRRNANRALVSQKEEIEEKSTKLLLKNEEIHLKNTELHAQSTELKATVSKLQKAQSQLVHSEKMASVGVLTAGIAHEINNPLNFIHGGKSALDKYAKKHLKDYQERLKPILETIGLGIKRSTDLVLSLNRFSRSGNNRSEECDIHIIIENCLSMLNNSLKDRVEIVKDFTSSSFRLIGQEGELHQIFLNLIMNSSQSIDEQGTISIKAEVVDETLIIQITDTGNGIRDEDLKKVTNPFFTTKDPGKGTGLGASIAYNITKDHKGSIEYFSVLSKGTTVKVALPIVL